MQALSRPNDTTTKKCRKNVLALIIIFLSTTLSSSLPPVAHIRGVTWQALLSFPHYSHCLRSNREKLHVQNFHEISSMQPSTHAIIRGYAVLSAFTLFDDSFVSGFDLDPNEHTRNTFSYSILTSNFVWILDIGIEIFQNYYRY